jgi:microcystin-dependent protein
MKLKLTLMAASAAVRLSLGFGAAAVAETDPFIGEIRPVGMTWCPRSWAPLNGQLLAISSNQALFSLIGCQYGGDCRTSFALPEMRGRTMIGWGQGPGQPNYPIAARSGAQNGTLTTANLPAHNHFVRASSNDPERNSPGGSAIPTIPNVNNEIYSDQPPSASATMRSGTVGNTGNQQSFNLYQPSIAVNYCMALQGTFPSRN